MTRQAVMTHINMLKRIPNPASHGKAGGRLREMQGVHAEWLCKWYAEEVGYNPLVDNPSMTMLELAALCEDYVGEMDHYKAWTLSDHQRGYGPCAS